MTCEGCAKPAVFRVYREDKTFPYALRTKVLCAGCIAEKIGKYALRIERIKEKGS